MKRFMLIVFLFFPLVCWGDGFINSYRYDMALQYADAYSARVTDDGGTVISYNDVYNAYAFLINNDLYTSCKLWCSARFGVKKDGSNNLSKIYDISSSALDGTYSGNTPVWISSAQNGEPGIAFSATDINSTACALLHGSSTIMAGANSAFVVVNGSESAYAYQTFLTFGTRVSLWQTNHINGYADGDMYYGTFAQHSSSTPYNLIASTTPASTTTYYIYSHKYDSGWKITDFSLNNTSIGSSTTNTIMQETGLPLVIGACSSNVPSSKDSGWNGHINEYLILDREYSSEEYTAIMNYLNGIWDIY